MNAKHDHHTAPTTMPSDDVFVSTLIPARHWIASIAAVVMTGLTLAMVSVPVRTPELSWINGIHVTNLAPVIVTPSVEDLRVAALLGDVTADVLTLPASGNSERAARFGSQLAMPYYSFGNQFGQASKE